MRNASLALWNISKTAIKYIVSNKLQLVLCDVDRVVKIRVIALAFGVLGIAGCASGPVPSAPLPFYRCEYGIEFTAKFSGDSVVLDSTRGYDVLYRGGKPASPEVTVDAKARPNAYSNSRMSAEFKLGALERDAVVRYPLLPLVSRCARDN